MYKSFTEISVWKNAHELAKEVHHLTIRLPKSEDYSLTSQIRRAASSVPANISEASGRQTKKDKSNFYVIARGSGFETQNHLIYGEGIGYFIKEETDNLIKKYNDLIFEISKIIRSLS
ncbi:MAG: four helix bundle protein [Prolixibacteraceae bacterium]|nr:four helix bundle protein [Prolixibacteraceae bacterium]